MFAYARGKMTIGFANVASITVSTQKFVNHPRTKLPWDRVFNTEHTSNFEGRKHKLNISIITITVDKPLSVRTWDLSKTPTFGN